MPLAVVKLEKPNLLDVAQMLRRTADEIEQGRLDAPHALLVIECADRSIEIRGYGQVQDNRYEAGLLLHAANSL